MNQLSQDEIKQLEEVKGANPLYFKAFMKASEIMPQRRADYSGKHDAYFNFRFMKDMLQLWFGERVIITMRDTMAFYRILKFARWIVGKQQDSTVDDINYGLLDLGEEISADIPPTQNSAGEK